MKAKDYRQVLQELGNIMDEAVHIVDATGKTILYNEKMAGLEMTNPGGHPRKALSRSFFLDFPLRKARCTGHSKKIRRPLTSSRPIGTDMERKLQP